MKLTLDGPCAELEKKATFLPPKYFDMKATDALEYCKNVTCPFKEAARRVAQFVSTIQHHTCMYMYMCVVYDICVEHLYTKYCACTVPIHNYVLYQLR